MGNSAVGPQSREIIGQRTGGATDGGQRLRAASEVGSAPGGQAWMGFAYGPEHAAPASSLSTVSFGRVSAGAMSRESPHAGVAVSGPGGAASGRAAPPGRGGAATGAGALGVSATSGVSGACGSGASPSCSEGSECASVAEAAPLEPEPESLDGLAAGREAPARFAPGLGPVGSPQPKGFIAAAAAAAAAGGTAARGLSSSASAPVADLAGLGFPPSRHASMDGGDAAAAALAAANAPGGDATSAAAMLSQWASNVGLRGQTAEQQAAAAGWQQLAAAMAGGQVREPCGLHLAPCDHGAELLPVHTTGLLECALTEGVALSHSCYLWLPPCRLRWAPAAVRAA
jgi:hypothetical protein